MSSITSYRSYPNLVTSGAFQITLNATATTSITLPTSGTLAVTGANNSFTSTQTVTVAPASNTSSDGIVLQDTTAASSGNQQYSGRFRWSGKCWETTGPSSQTVDWAAELVPVQGTTASSNLVFSSQINGGGFCAGIKPKCLAAIRGAMVLRCRKPRVNNFPW